MKSSRKRNVARKAKNTRTHTSTGNAPPQPSARPAQAEPPAVQSAEAQPVTNQAPTSDGFVSQNRANALRSTGPRTAEGKAASSQNAFKHGLSIQRHAVLRDEDPALYEELLAELREIYQPLSPREDLAVEDLAQCRWALARFDKAEAVCLEKLTDWINDPEAFPGEEILGAGESLGHAATVLTDFDDKDRRFVEPDTHYPAFDKIHRYRTYWERKHTRALAEFDRAQRARRAEAAEHRAEAAELRAEAAHHRAEAQARRQAEAHALKEELALARESRQRELHERRSAQAREKLRRQPIAQPSSAHSEPPESAESAEDAALRALESLMNAPTPVTEEDFLRSKLSQAPNGFVSQNPPVTHSAAADRLSQIPASR